MAVDLDCLICTIVEAVSTSACKSADLFTVLVVVIATCVARLEGIMSAKG